MNNKTGSVQFVEHQDGDKEEKAHTTYRHRERKNKECLIQKQSHNKLTTTGMT